MELVLWVLGLFLALWGGLIILGSDFFWGLILIGLGITVMVLTSDKASKGD